MSPLPAMLETNRLTLRRFIHDDWLAMHAHYGDAECTRHTFRRVLTEGESWRAMASIEGHWALRGYGPYAVVETTSQSVIGTVGPWYPNDWPEPEIKWALVRSAWGRGYASEAVCAIQHVLSAAGWSPPISFIHHDNAPSIRVALAVGALLEQVVTFRDAPWHIYRHPTQPANPTSP
ncbi:GNAT family N-acetyltransferase [Chitinolyticbacter meiyuanensis]|uniref:GNAT family N-acetyltransferase n=1 Tax=Chitinolyticbacter meiyuanensis TaxID=682798 RepID=UPI0011E5A5C6|nr:GNAT family N-acetyltransferase [Chitinolyticbacter meiyuanensis]